MFKKICVLISCAIMLLALYIANAQPVFKNYASRYEIYLNSSSSIADIVTVKGLEILKYKNLYGESVKVDAENFSLNKILNDFSAKLVLTEYADGVTCYYAYSPKIKYLKQVKGKLINLHVAVRQDQVTLGTPLIYGGF